MALVKLRFEVANEVQLSRAFETIGSAGDDLTQPFNQITDEFYASQANVFQAEGAFEQRPRWNELSPTYRKWKERHYPGRKILELTGRLRQSLTVKGGLDNVTKVSPKEMVVGTIVPYAMIHQTGRGRIPQRKILDLTPDQMKRWIHIMHAFLFNQYQKGAQGASA